MRKVTLAVLFFLLLSIHAFGSAITYTQTVTGTGVFADHNFNSALVTLTFTGDTANVTPLGSCCLQNIVGIMTVDVQGIGSGTFTDASMGAVVNPSNEAAGMSDFTRNLAVLFTLNPVFSTYDLASSIGPYSGGASINSTIAFATTIGNFQLNSADGDATFTAVTNGSAPVPEPSSLMLFGSSLAGFAGMFRRKLSR